VSQFTKGSSKLEAYRPAHSGVAIDRLLSETRLWLSLANDGLRGEDVVLEETSVPKIHYNPDLAKENLSCQQ